MTFGQGAEQERERERGGLAFPPSRQHVHPRGTQRTTRGVQTKPRGGKTTSRR